MRIIAGRFRSRKLLSPPIGAATRPMPDRVKESLFSMLRGHFEGATVLDAFAGTGAIGLEAASRGAARVVLIERDKRVAEVIRRNIEMLGCADQAEVVITDMLGSAALARVPRPIDLVFFDPPYPLVIDPLGWERVKQQFVAAIRLLADDGFAMLRTPWPFRHSLDVAPAPSEDEDTPRRESDPKRRRAREDRHWDWRSELERPPREGEPDPEAPDAELDPSKNHASPAADAARDAEESAGQAEDDRLAAAAAGELVDLRMPGAKGPETHVYRHTGVHLYMRDVPANPPEPGT